MLGRLGGQRGWLVLSAAQVGKLHPAAQRPGRHSQITRHAGDRATATHHRADNSNAIGWMIAAAGKKAVIPPRANRTNPPDYD